MAASHLRGYAGVSTKVSGGQNAEGSGLLRTSPDLTGVYRNSREFIGIVSTFINSIDFQWNCIVLTL